jgi:hypothetical protein
VLQEIAQTHAHSRLRDDDLLSDPDALDDHFIAVYQHAIALADFFLDQDGAAEVRDAYLGFASAVRCEPIKGVEGLSEELWSGHHPVVILFRRLEHYGEKARYHYSDAETPRDSRALRHEIELASRFHDALPAHWLAASESGGKGRFGEILHAAQARYALDSGKALRIEDIIVLSGLNRRSVQNALSATGESGLRTTDNGKISNGEARRWLKKRLNFAWTQRYETLDRPATEVVSPGTPAEYVFVPRADDNSEFRPEVRRANGYQIGAKGEEKYVEDYFDALAELQSMPTARWRRPNADNNWGIVTATSWVRVPKDELVSALDDHQPAKEKNQ